MAIQLKSPDQIARMRVAGLLASDVLDMISEHVQPGVTTAELDRLCHRYMVDEQGTHARRLCETAYESLVIGIQTVRPGATLGDIGNAIQRYAEARRYSVVEEYCGHGIGSEFHEDPQVLHHGKPGQGVTLRPGMTFTIEPMINQGKRHARVLADGWTVVTKDRSLSAQWEHTIHVTETGCEVLTLAEGRSL